MTGPNLFESSSRQWTDLHAELAREKLQNRHESLRVEELQKRLAEVEKSYDAELARLGEFEEAHDELVKLCDSLTDERDAALKDLANLRALYDARGDDLARNAEDIQRMADDLEGIGERMLEAEAGRDELKDRLRDAEIELENFNSASTRVTVDAVARVRASAESERDALKAKLARYSMGAGEADLCRLESQLTRVALGFDVDDGDVCPADIRDGINALKAREAKLREALDRFGMHRDGCQALDVLRVCDCGLDRALYAAALSPSPKPPEAAREPPDCARREELRAALLSVLRYVEIFGHNDECLFRNGHEQCACDCEARHALADASAALSPKREGT